MKAARDSRAATAALLAGLLLAGCLEDHALRERGEWVALDSFLSRIQPIQGAQTVTLYLQEIAGPRRSIWWQGAPGQMGSIPSYSRWDGGTFRVEAKGTLTDGSICHASEYTASERKVTLDSCVAWSVLPVPQVVLLTKLDSTLAEVETEFQVRVTLSRGSLKRYAVRYGGSDADSGALAGGDTTLALKRRFRSLGPADVSFTVVTDRNETGGAGWKIQVVDQPLKAVAGPDTLLYTEHSPFTRIGRAEGSLGRIEALEWLIPEDSVLDAIKPSLTWTPVKLPDSLIAVLRVRDIYGRTVEDTAQFTVVYPARMGYARYKPFDRGAPDSAERLTAYSSHPARAAVRHEGDGTQEVEFAWDAPQSMTGNLQVTPVSAEPFHCTAFQPEATNLLARVLCLTPDGNPENAPFSLRGIGPMLGNTTGIHSYVSTDSLVLRPGFPANPRRSFNDGSPITLKHTGEGIYMVIFHGLGKVIGGPGSAMATAIEPEGAWCKVGAWSRQGDDVQVHVNCYWQTGGVTDARFSAAVMGPLKMKTNFELAYSVGPLGKADPDYAGANTVDYNSTGGDIVHAKAGTGRYASTFKGMGRAYRNRPATVQISDIGFGSNNTCQAAGWSGDPDLVVDVRCFTPTGAPVDSKYSISVVK